jgi:two-component system, response regulator YesN
LRFYNQSKKIHSCDEINTLEAGWNIKWSNWDLINSVRNLDRKNVSTQIVLLFENLNAAHISVNTLSHMLSGLIIELAKTTLDCGGNWESIYTKKYKDIDSLLKSESIDRIKSYISDLCFAAYEAIDKANEKEKDLDDIIKYINQFYNSELSLKKLADMFFVNSSYLGKLFKKKIGKSFNDYINEVRIQNAVNLIKDSSLSISEISERVGYNYIDHFYKNFKNYTGLNPGEYRKQR